MIDRENIPDHYREARLLIEMFQEGLAIGVISRSQIKKPKMRQIISELELAASELRELMGD